MLNWENYFSVAFINSHRGRRQHYYDLDMVYLAGRQGATPKWGGVSGYPVGSTSKIFFEISSLPGYFVRADEIRNWNSKFPNNKLVFMSFNGSATVPADFSEWDVSTFPIQWIGPVPTN